MRPSRFTWPFHSNCTEYYTKSNSILEEDKFLHHMTPTSVSYVQNKSGSHELWVNNLNNLCLK